MSRFIAITKDLQIPINFGILITLVGGVFALAMRISSWEQKLDAATQNRWTYTMEKESWHEFARANPDVKAPNVQVIKTDNTTTN